MRLSITHATRYTYDQPVPYALQQLRLTPKSHGAQKVLRWSTEVEGGKKELTFEDSHRNTVDLISFDAGTQGVTVTCTGEVEVRETHGIVGQHAGFMPVWMFQRETALTRPGPATRKLAQSVGQEPNVLKRMHDLMACVADAVAYKPGRSHVKSTAEEVLAAKEGVCQDQAHVFIAAARALGVPARYVSGYLMMDGRVDQDATHAWAEACIPDLGWVGFDVANAMCPDTRYVRVATGLDYAEAAPVSGMRLGSGAEVLTVTVAVQQQ
jgi:transglutaminase-like putative cysteine protease